MTGAQPDEKRAAAGACEMRKSASEKAFENREMLHMINTEVGPFVTPKVPKVDLGMQPPNKHTAAKKVDPSKVGLGHSQSEKELGMKLPMHISTIKRVPRPVVDIKSKFIKVDFKQMTEEIKARDKARAEFVAERNAKRAEEEMEAKKIEKEKRAAGQAKVAAAKAARQKVMEEETAKAKELIKAARGGA